ncbi:ribosome biogenesis protein bop1-B-like [Stylophora pistillata]|uniref:ribosome biogenesis protein bop1-B-like n=1 Tax=Stylophora pistillata TaxID=50429 RepID=UPI000C048F02|nr:ribosome biogenesis protein bop1-B-like [Stylophora pistillata]
MPKRTSDQTVHNEEKFPKEVDENLFHFDENQTDRIKEDVDSSDSEESYYSGLESESETTEDDEDEQDSNSGEEEISGHESFDGIDNEEKSDDDNETNKGNGEPNNNIEDAMKKKGKEPIDENDTSDEEDARNTVGNIPVEWYNDYPHIGYNLDGQRILKPATADELDQFLSKMDDPNYWRTVRDKATMKEVVLSNEELDIIDRLQNSQFPGAGYDPYEPYVDFFTGEKMIHPLTNAPEPKSRHIPSKWEHKRVVKIVRAIRNGWIKPKKDEKTDKPRYYLIWDKDDDGAKPRHNMHIPAPKMKLPGHEESYNPPPEYLPTEQEIAAWEAMDPDERPRNFLPKKYSSLRLVPAYNKFIQERFERCLDLYLCPRQRKMRIQVNPEDLLPKLPRPKDLQPFPSTESMVYKGHTAVVRCLAVDPTGQWIPSGGDDKVVKFWEVCTGRCLKTLQCGGTVNSMAWNPNPSLTLLAIAVDHKAVVVNHSLGDKLLCAATDELIESYTRQGEDEKESGVQWSMAEEKDYRNGERIVLKHSKVISQVTWHGKGDYFASVVPQGGNKSVFIHQMTKRRSQCPFKKSKGLIQRVLFHPTRPFLFVATQRFIRVYNLTKQELTKKLVSNVKWISSMAVHPKGDNLIVGSYDRRLCWFDMDLSTKPYKTLRSHKKALRQVAFHRHYPLFASASDDGTVIICHGRIFNDLMQNPLIVPVKVLKGHRVEGELGVVDCQFHPSQPWIFTAGADHLIRLYT